MKKSLRQTALNFLILCLLAATLASCSSIPLKGDETITLQYLSQGNLVSESTLMKDSRFSLPPDPVRTGYKFNGWWVTCSEGVVRFDRDWLCDNLDNDVSVINARWLNTSYTFTQQTEFSTPVTIQDGAVFNTFMFKFNSEGLCYVYDTGNGNRVGTFMLAGTTFYKPHCNAVCFSNVFYENGDEFPLLYANIYNNYKKETDTMAGTVCVYRIQREDSYFTSTLVQVIRVGFADYEPWRSVWNAEKDSFTDRSPWGNFIVDTDNGKLWAFVTRDINHTTRFFCFDLPEVPSDGTMQTVTLSLSDVERYFDVPYSWYLQGACYSGGKIYSCEGMGTDANPTRIRVIDLESGSEDSVIDLYADKNHMREAEFMDVHDGALWYGDYKKNNGNPSGFIYKITGF
ncbi:MAG: hypothetical protein IKT95_05150 [Spirochaetales bacterium]|nr:hypothetical protein [Spirochaetales bacterium]